MNRISQPKAIIVSRPPTRLAAGFISIVGKLFLGLVLAAGTAGSVQALSLIHI